MIGGRADKVELELEVEQPSLVSFFFLLFLWVSDSLEDSNYYFDLHSSCRGKRWSWRKQFVVTTMEF